MNDLMNEYSGAPLKCWLKGVHDMDVYGWIRWLAICRIRWVDGTNSWMLYLGRRTFRLLG